MTELHAIFRWLAIFFAGLALAGTAYYVLCVYSALKFLFHRRKLRKQAGAFMPPVTILKPVRGVDPMSYESFRSHCVQDYPAYEIIFGVGDAADPAIPLIEKLKKEFPARRIELVVCTEFIGMNRKINNVLQMLPEARHDFLILNDGDIRVQPDYLRRVLAPFAAPDVGLVTCLYHGVASGTLGSRIEALGISTDFSAGVLTAREIEGGVHFALGSTLAFRRAAIKSIGGLETLLDYIADDFQLGKRISAAGYKVLLSDVSVETFVPAYSLREFFQHQLRWGRSTRNSRPWGYTGLALTFGVPWAMAAAALAQGATWSLYLLLAALVARIAMALTVGVGILRDRQVWRDLLLLPLRDVMALAIWVSSYAGSKVSWRGTRFILENGKMRPVT